MQKLVYGLKAFQESEGFCLGKTEQREEATIPGQKFTRAESSGQFFVQVFIQSPPTPKNERKESQYFNRNLS